MTMAEAVRFFETQDYDLIVLDVNLPDGNGFELVKIISFTEHFLNSPESFVKIAPGDVVLPPLSRKRYRMKPALAKAPASRNPPA